jgi:hypothetical protein
MLVDSVRTAIHFSPCPISATRPVSIGMSIILILYEVNIDALPIQEQVSQDFTSTNDGVMHACGHDIHMARL